MHCRALPRAGAPDEKYSASDIARVASDLMSDAAAGPAASAAAASERASKAPLAASSGAPAAAHSAATCWNKQAVQRDTRAAFAFF